MAMLRLMPAIYVFLFVSLFSVPLFLFSFLPVCILKDSTWTFWRILLCFLYTDFEHIALYNFLSSYSRYHNIHIELIIAYSYSCFTTLNKVLNLYFHLFPLPSPLSKYVWGLHIQIYMHICIGTYMHIYIQIPTSDGTMTSALIIKYDFIN